MKNYKVKCIEFLTRAKTLILSDYQYNYFMKKALECAISYKNLPLPTEGELWLIKEGRATEVKNKNVHELIYKLIA